MFGKAGNSINICYFGTVSNMQVNQNRLLITRHMLVRDDAISKTV